MSDTSKTREAYLLWPQKPKPLAGPGYLIRMQINQALTLAAMTVAGSVAFGLAYLVLPEQEISWGFLPALAAAIGSFWYMEFQRPSTKERALVLQALERANCPVKNLHFTNGQTGSFNPKGSILMRTGGVALGFDPQHQLIRHVQRSPLEGKITIDWIFGLEEIAPLEVAETPTPGLRNRLRRLVGRPLALRNVLRFRDLSGNASDVPIHPGYLSKAQSLVREMNFHRPVEKAQAS